MSPMSYQTAPPRVGVEIARKGTRGLRRTRIAVRVQYGFVMFAQNRLATTHRGSTNIRR
jgi:hypothetical protein